MLELIVSRVTAEAEGVRGIELRRPCGGALPAFTAGAHIDVHLPGNIVRQYSLCNDPAQTDRYCLGVGLAPSSRGGSQYLHDAIEEGHSLKVSMPRSLFGIDAAATAHVFIAGGIGITPILSMIRWCEANDRPWKLLYCMRSRRRAAYLDAMSGYGERVQLHVDDESHGALADLSSFLGALPEGSHVYCCGPSPLMDAVAAKADAAGVPRAATHFERFGADPQQAGANADADHAFTVVLHRHGGRFTVPAGATILETLEQNGVPLPFSCREGLCRSCEVPLLAGKADHRDYVLSGEEREANTAVMICVSRALTPELELDI
ncbi:PDR/VanB family oxidoreductase [Cupriavidus sp. CV2]|uniref:PDR/VanB family oxidoreductase n=1 Tax=Cupriavidus ulmosensis TaxID=3065913 RepID=UPI00296AA676|nr:PDR/VanB family oxidoreductase [Cupriavidus sp. CV2]MDW3681989.1 PDR/VanB family oxidoreductase [Cupriavidus sp. CV2]